MAQAQHPDLELSLYLDAALAPDARRRVEAHLATCDDCRARLHELRAVTRLVAALPERAPRRSLVPTRRALPGWLVPARWASTLATAAFILVFVVTNVPFVARQTAAPAFAPIGNNLADSGAATSSATALPEVQPAPAPTVTANYTAVDDPQKRTAFSTSPMPTDTRVTTQARGSVAPTQPAARTFSDQVDEAPTWLWLVPAALFAAIALGLQWRISQVR